MDKPNEKLRKEMFYLLGQLRGLAEHCHDPANIKFNALLKDMRDRYDFIINEVLGAQ